MDSGPAQLKDWMDRRGFDQRETAKYFDWDETFISKLVRGDRSPGLANAILIERHTGIPVEAWTSSEQDKSGVRVSVDARKRR